MASDEPTFKGSGLFMNRPEREMFEVSDASSGSGEPTSRMRKRSGICNNCRGLTRFSGFCTVLSWREGRGRREAFKLRGGGMKHKAMREEVKYQARTDCVRRV